MNEVEQLVIKNLLLDEEYVRKALPFIKSEYFSELTGKKLFTVVTKYFTDYSALPTKEALEIEVGQLGNISDEQHKQTIQYIRDIDDEKSEYDVNGLMKPNSEMGYISSVSDARKKLEKVFKLNQET